MIFALPEYLWLLPLVLLPTAVLVIWAESWRKQACASCADLHLISHIMRCPNRFRIIIGGVCILLTLLLMVIALMRPQWGLIPEEQTSKGLDIVIALDISRSMLADDLQPSRLAVAKSAINKLLDTLSGDRIGIIAFSGTAFTVCPLTNDYSIARQIVHDLVPESLPYGGSAVASAFREAQRSFRGTKNGGRVLIVVSDGEDHAGNIASALQTLTASGVTVLAAIAGTESGGLMPLPDGGYVKDQNGAVVKSHASRSVIVAIDPEAVSLGHEGTGLELLLQRARSVGSVTEHKEQRQRLAERFQLPLAAALLLLSVATCVGRGLKG